MTKEDSAVGSIWGVDEDMAFAAIFENRPFTLKFQIGRDENVREMELSMVWPDGDDEMEINARAAMYLNVLPSYAMDNDKAWARGRAVIEVLAAPTFPEWLTGPNGEYLDKKAVVWHGKESRRPDTGKLKSRALPVAVYYAYADVIERFHVLAAG